MILEEDALMRFRYDTTTHILSVVWPETTSTSIPELDNSLKKLARNIKNFDIRTLLSDLRAGFEGIDMEDYKGIIEDYHRNLANSRLKKVARIIPEKPAWEYFVRQYSKELVDKYNLPFEVRFFTRKADALAWLQEPE